MSTETTAPAETTPERCTDCGQERGPEAVWAVVTDTYGASAGVCRECGARRLVLRCGHCRRHHGDESGWVYFHPENGAWERHPNDPLPAWVDGYWRVLCPDCLELPAGELLGCFE